MNKPTLKPGTQTLQFDIRNRDFFKTEVEKHTDCRVSFGEDYATVENSWNTEDMWHNTWLVVWPGGDFDVLPVEEYEERFRN